MLHIVVNILTYFTIIYLKKSTMRRFSCRFTYYERLSALLLHSECEYIILAEATKLLRLLLDTIEFLTIYVGSLIK